MPPLLPLAISLPAFDANGGATSGETARESAAPADAARQRESAKNQKNARTQQVARTRTCAQQAKKKKKKNSENMRRDIRRGTIHRCPSVTEYSMTNSTRNPAHPDHQPLLVSCQIASSLLTPPFILLLLFSPDAILPAIPASPYFSNF
jgi:hypothetical protein